MPKSKQFVESSDDSSDSESKARKSVPKKSKRQESEDDKPKQTKKPRKEAKNETKDSVWELGNNRNVTVREFKGKLLVDIREMYMDKEGALKPGKKEDHESVSPFRRDLTPKIQTNLSSICMNMQQWRKFMEVVSDVDEAVKAKC